MTLVKNIINNLPSSPGVYQFYDKNGEILYVGKAKNLKNRVSSYFNKNKYESFKTKKLASQVFDIKHIVVENEMDALFLENNLIKQFQPKYNVLLKDDKTFPWICIKNEKFPRIFSTRKRISDGSDYFGPYTSAIMVRTLLNLIRQLYQIRTCNFLLTSDNIEKGKFKVCLENHLGNCKGPCEGKQTNENYNESIGQIRDILKGNLQYVLDYLEQLMLEFSLKYKFEEAEKIKNKIEILQKFKSKSTIVNPKINDVDVFSFINESNTVFVNFIKIINGAIVQSHTVEIVKQLDESKEDLLLYAIIDIRTKVFSDSKDILVPFALNDLGEIQFTVPKIGDKKKLMELSERNARQYANQVQIQKAELTEKKKKNSIIDRAKIDLRLKDLPTHIECFDNSNIQGKSPVAACVVFLNGKPAKKEYRHFHVKTVIGANDFASMEEIIFRRYKRMLDENKELPQLIIIDGGKGQLGSAVNSLSQLGLYGKIAILGIAKRLEELYFPNDPVPLYLDKNSSTLKLIQHLRNEAHRFGISFHRNTRMKSMFENSLEKINGVGDKTIEKLIKKFGSIEQMSDKSLEEIQEIVPKNTAKKIVDYFNSIKQE